MAPNLAEQLQASTQATKSQPMDVGKINLPKLLGRRCRFMAEGFDLVIGGKAEGGRPNDAIHIVFDVVCVCLSQHGGG